ncbi:MAG: flagellar basal body rod protein FlgC [Anaeromicrobium sp.]|uniref:flagellar basal body rod protein FlgC n=1 Tax=Anaeromicrobium sp. TaxID=1929132 RepID=UPI0025FC46D7|nr:flagellar basal body rod protein FlgC [Anaeromicrobium sp.]MCT4595575.1 flagellar basal body rod protein FlgC [Anaeromicrobium sp.]
MGLFNSINVSASGLTAQRLRMDIISKNIANANTTRTSNGSPYRRQMAVFQKKNPSFDEVLKGESNRQNQSGGGVEVSAIVEDKSPFRMVYEPGHPDADKDGYVKMPNVDVVTEMINMVSATRSFEANITSINSTKGMLMKALEIGK